MKRHHSIRTYSLITLVAAVGAQVACTVGAEPPPEEPTASSGGLAPDMMKGGNPSSSGGSSSSGSSSGGVGTGSSSGVGAPLVPITALPQGITGGFSYINTNCGLNLGKLLEDVAVAVVDVAECVAEVAASAASSDCDPTEDPTCAPPSGSCGGSISFVPLTSCGGGSFFTSPVGSLRTLAANTSKGTFIVESAQGWNVMTDGDLGLKSGSGFYHQELTTAGGGVQPTQTDAFVLPAGAACGFHHTQVSPANKATGAGTCMGYDAAISCPQGWTQRFVFDDSSGDGNVDCTLPTSLRDSADCGHWVWCEYKDPYNLGETAAALTKAAQSGVAMNLSAVVSEADYGVSAAGQSCPSGWTRTAYFDDGRPAGQGLSSCLPPPPSN